jgi:hypothetical protein
LTKTNCFRAFRQDVPTSAHCRAASLTSYGLYVTLNRSRFQRWLWYERKHAIAKLGSPHVSNEFFLSGRTVVTIMTALSNPQSNFYTGHQPSSPLQFSPFLPTLSPFIYAPSRLPFPFLPLLCNEVSTRTFFENLRCSYASYVFYTFWEPYFTQ